jgi:phenylacetate-CoA ligase
MIFGKNFNHSAFRLYHSIRGWNTCKNLRDLEISQWGSVSEIRQLQWTKLKNIIKHAYLNVPYYTQIFNNLGLVPESINTFEDFNKLPLLTKDDIEQNFGSIVASNYCQKDLIKNSTGGSTGRNLTFFIDRKRSGFRSAVTLRGNKLAGLDIGVKHAYLWGSPFDLSLQKKLINKAYNKIIGCDLFLSSYDLSEESMFLYAKQIQNYNPYIIIGYPSPLYFFAKFLEKNNIKLVNPKSIITSAEVLYDYQRELIEGVFGCKIFNRYGSREFNIIAQECSEHSGLHINSEHVYVECVGKNGMPSLPEELGELIITDLDNYAMPFIRYKIGDMGVLSDDKCKCGRGLPILKHIDGRTFDVIKGTNGKSLGGTFWTLLFRNTCEGIKQFQIIQETYNKINISIVIDSLFKVEYIDLLTNRIHHFIGEDMVITFKIVNEIKPTSSGKFRFVISKVDSAR